MVDERVYISALLLEKIVFAMQAIPLIAAHFSVVRSIVWRTRAPGLNH